MTGRDDATWVEEAVAAHEARLLRFAATIVGKVVALDVVQDTFVELCMADRAAMVAGFGMLLRESDFVGTFQLEDVVRLAEASLDDDTNGHRRGFVDLVRRAAALPRPR